MDVIRPKFEQNILMKTDNLMYYNNNFFMTRKFQKRTSEKTEIRFIILSSFGKILTCAKCVFINTIRFFSQQGINRNSRQELLE